MKDARGLDVSANDPAAVAAADDFAARLLRLDQGVEGILEAAKRWPDTPIIQLYAAAFWLYGQTDGVRETAAAHLRACEVLAMNRRERALHRALALWHGNDNLYAVEALEAITAEWPGDLFTAKLAEFLYYVLGQQYMGPRFRAHIRRLEPAHAEDPDFLAMAAFASELCGDYGEAEARAERALGIAARNPWAQHALSHVLIRQGRVREGLARLESFLPLLATCGRPIPLSRRLASCIAASRAARRGRGNARVSHAYLGHHSGFRGRATRRHRLAVAHRDGRYPYGCAMAFDRRARRCTGGRDIHAVHERALRLRACARRI
jgi:tetratricopeptide (TPR) repeat protein